MLPPQTPHFRRPENRYRLGPEAKPPPSFPNICLTVSSRRRTAVARSSVTILRWGVSDITHSVRGRGLNTLLPVPGTRILRRVFQVVFPAYRVFSRTCRTEDTHQERLNRPFCGCGASTPSAFRVCAIRFIE